MRNHENGGGKTGRFPIGRRYRVLVDAWPASHPYRRATTKDSNASRRLRAFHAAFAALDRFFP